MLHPDIRGKLDIPEFVVNRAFPASRACLDLAGMLASKLASMFSHPHTIFACLNILFIVVWRWQA